MGVRIIDIAKLANVSPATVSLVLNGKSGAGEETRARVRRIAAELDYQGGYQGARSAAHSASESICFLHIARHGHTVNRDHDVFIADYIEGLSHGSNQHGLSLEILTFKSTSIEKIIEAAEAHRAAGVIVLGTELTLEDVEAFSQIRKPVVFIDIFHDFLKFDFVDMNNEDSVFTIVEHFASLGHRRIGMVKGSIETRNFKLREESFIASLKHHGLTFDERLLFAVDPTFHGAYEDMLALLRRGAELPSALFCVNDIIACGCLKAFSEMGVRVPEDVSLIGFDDLPLSAVVDPPLTTIQVSKSQIGRMAIQLLITRIRSEADTPPVKVLIGGRLVERKSVRAASTEWENEGDG